MIHRHTGIWGGEKAFGLSLSDRRQHLFPIGKTGSEKTPLLRNLIVQHLAAGHGVGLIDPHGNLAERLLDCIPPCRGDRVDARHEARVGAYPRLIAPLQLQDFALFKFE